MKHNKPLIIILALALCMALCGCIPTSRYATEPPASSFTPTPTPDPLGTDDPDPVTPTQNPDPDGLQPGPDSTYSYPQTTPETVEVRVLKSQKRVMLVGDGVEFASFPCIIGSSPEGTKTKSGDNKTPEGDYYICKVADSEKFTKVFTISYPNTQDAQNGYTATTIDQATRDKIVTAISKNEAPPMNTKLGGDIGIVGKLGSETSTSGSIRIHDANLAILNKWAKVGTKVTILP
ncbi:L,D-transpeptidase family protein [Eubacteriales bacterium OttesenSCG-928-N14]|nr:L,D-transpeptidase family protein [Eubacteriales bacterium OttesenSCG-928-N14]